MYGHKLRTARLAQDMSLQQVAEKAKISTATLSRIETAKQTLDVGTLLVLAKILKLRPSDIVDDAEPRAERDDLVQKLVQLDPRTRTEVWQLLAARRRGEKQRGRQAGDVALEVEELLSQIDFLRAEIESVKRHIR